MAHSKGFSYKIIEMSSKRRRPRTEKVRVNPAEVFPGLSNLHCTNQASTVDDHVEDEDDNLMEAVSVDDGDSKRKSYASRVQLQTSEWIKLRSQFQRIGVEREAPSSSVCSICNCFLDQPIRCNDCHPLFVCCDNCEEQHHVNVLHKPEIWKGSLFVPYNTIKYLRLQDHNDCHRCKTVPIELIDYKGRPHSGMATICGEHSLAVGLFRHGFWPSSPTNPSAGIALDLMRFLATLTLESAMSVKKFINTLQILHRLTNAEAVHLYTLLTGDTVAEFHVYHQSTLPEFSQRRIRCPACPKNEGVATVSLDGNFGLVRKKNSGSSCRSPYTTDIYFINSDETDAFMASYCQDDIRDKECSSFLAGDALRSQKRNDKLDIRGVFGSVCRHEFPVIFLDMKHGERLGYSVLLTKKLQELFGSNVKLQIIYDIGCILSRHLKRTNNPLLEEIDLAVPVWHVMGHNSRCQVTFSCRHKEGFGLVDGEGVERLWSQIRPHAAITKEMTPSHRTDLLNCVILHYATKKLMGLGKWLDTRALRAQCIFQESETQLKEFLQVNNVTYDAVVQWSNEYKHQLTTLLDITEDDGLTWQIKYSEQLQSYYSMQTQLQTTNDLVLLQSLPATIERVNNLLKKTEGSKKITRWQEQDPQFIQCNQAREIKEKQRILQKLFQDASERAFYKSLLPKYSDGQSIYKRLSQQLTRATSAVNRGVNLYNSCSGNTIHMPQQITFKEADNPSDKIYCCLQLPLEHGVPSSTKLKALQLLDMNQRSKEEITRVSDDIRRTTENFNEIHISIVNSANEMGMSKAEKASSLKELSILEILMSEIWSVAQKFSVDVPCRQCSEELLHCFENSTISAGILDTEYFESDIESDGES